MRPVNPSTHSLRCSEDVSRLEERIFVVEIKWDILKNIIIIIA